MYSFLFWYRLFNILDIGSLQYYTRPGAGEDRIGRSEDNLHYCQKSLGCGWKLRELRNQTADLCCCEHCHMGIFIRMVMGSCSGIWRHLCHAPAWTSSVTQWQMGSSSTVLSLRILIQKNEVATCPGWLCVNQTQAGVIIEKGASGEDLPTWAPAVRHFLN